MVHYKKELSIYWTLKIWTLVLSLGKKDSIRWQYVLLLSPPLSLGMNPGSHSIPCFAATLARVCNTLACFEMWLVLLWKKEKNTNLNIFLYGSKSETSFCLRLDNMRIGCQYQLHYMVNKWCHNVFSFTIANVYSIPERKYGNPNLSPNHLNSIGQKSMIIMVNSSS